MSKTVNKPSETNNCTIGRGREKINQSNSSSKKKKVEFHARGKDRSEEEKDNPYMHRVHKERERDVLA